MLTNQACLTMLEIDGPIESCYGRTLSEVFYNDPAHETLIGQSMRDGNIFRDVEVCTKSHKCKSLYILVNVFPMYDQEAICIGGMCI